MKRTLNLDARLLAEARAACGAATDTEAIHRGLQALVRRAALERLAAYREPDALRTLPRRRREAPPARRAAR